MKLSQFKINIPETALAQHPSHFRDESKLMILHKDSGEIEHKQFKDLRDIFGKNDCFVLNDTKVFPAKLLGSKDKTKAIIKVFLLRELKEEQLLWDVQVDPARKIRIGNKLYFGDNEDLVAEVIDNTTSRGRTLRFLYDGTHDEFKETLYRLGHTPLPDYIDREENADDSERYQTIFAKEEGAVVAPAAGLHFSRELMKMLEINDCRFAYLTLHCSPCAYDDIDVDDLTKYKMGSEQMVVKADCTSMVNDSKQKGGRIISVGTSTLKALETCVSTDGFIKEFEGWTSRFIFPPYDFKLADALITNFHLSQSSLLMMAAAFGEYEHVMEAYKIALKMKYRFGAYGDAMLIM